MKFESKEISIDDAEFGCTITFSENADEYKPGQTVEELMNSTGQYVMLQRTYPEDEYEEDYIYFECSDFDKSGEMNNFEIRLSSTQFILNFDDEVYEIQINADDRPYEKLKEALKIITNNKGKLNIQ